MLVSFARFTVQVIRAGSVTDHGLSVESWATATSHAVPGCLVDTGAGDTDSEHRQAVRTDLTVLMPPGSDVKASDHIRVPGYSDDFQIVSGPQIQSSPTGRLDQIQLGLNVWSG